ncbi:MAG TPA: tetratricopeptide repeat protein, partial [Terriglobia bacterium]|nr:tetratricopeptide repeat protein [Terriglobia bacterium]
ESFRVLMSLGRLYVLIADEKLQDPLTRDSAPPIFRQAYNLLAAAAARDPKSAMASYMVGSVEFRLGSYKDAEKDLKHALELDPSVFPARITLINVYVAQRMWQDALENIDEFILGNPSSAFRQEVMATRAVVIRRLSPNP